MVYVKIPDEKIKYHIEDILKLFYTSEDIRFASELPPGYRGLFIYGELSEATQTETMIFKLVFEAEGLRYYKDFHIGRDAFGDNKLEARKSFTSDIKRCFYEFLVEYTGKQAQWGMLTGIRPAKKVHEMLEKGEKKSDILNKLVGHYYLSPKKAQLLYNVAQAEKNILSNNSPDLISIYIGIPFCATRCLYCSFTSNPISRNTDIVEKYIQALCKEIELVKRIIDSKGYRIQSIYIGGGTPTSIDAKSLEILTGRISSSFDLRNLMEYTVEAGRPDSMDEEKLLVLKNSPVTRISINPQTMNDETLKLIGRQHSADDIVKAFELARKLGFANINADLIAGLPGETCSMFAYTLSRIKELDPESLTVHTMSVKRASRLKEEKDMHELASSEEVAAMVDMAGDLAHEAGMHPYYLYRQKNILGNLENVGYCKRGFESIYNIQIMEEKQTIIALGAGAVTKVVYPLENRIERAFNVKSVEEYTNRVTEMVDRKRKLLLGAKLY